MPYVFECGSESFDTLAGAVTSSRTTFRRGARRNHGAAALAKIQALRNGHKCGRQRGSRGSSETMSAGRPGASRCVHPSYTPPFSAHRIARAVAAPPEGPSRLRARCPQAWPYRGSQIFRASMRTLDQSQRRIAARRTKVRPGIRQREIGLGDGAQATTARNP